MPWSSSSRPIRECYERQIAPLSADVARLTGVIEVIAELTPWAKKKSAETPYGVYGVRESTPTVECVDRHALTVWAATERPDIVRMKITLPLAEAKERFTDAELDAFATGDIEWGAFKGTIALDAPLPAGVAIVPAKRIPYAKPMGA